MSGAKFLELHKHEVRRITLLRTRVNNGKHKAGTARSPGSHTSLSVCLSYLALYATTSPAVTWGGFGIKGARCSATNSLALKVDCSSASLCSKTLIDATTPSPASTQ